VSSGAKFGGAGFLEFENDNVDVLRGVFFYNRREHQTGAGPFLKIIQFADLLTDRRRWLFITANYSQNGKDDKNRSSAGGCVQGKHRRE